MSFAFGMLACLRITGKVNGLYKMFNRRLQEYYDVIVTCCHGSFLRIVTIQFWFFPNCAILLETAIISQQFWY